MREAAKSRRRFPRSPAASPCRAIGLVAVAFTLSGCLGHGSPPPDTAIVTGSIPGNPGAATAEEASDRDAVRKAVSAADAGKAGPAGIPWADPATGTVGVITALAQTEGPASTCRSFETSRHSYDGIALYIGEACQAADGGPWRLIEFRPKNPPPPADAGPRPVPAG